MNEMLGVYFPSFEKHEIMLVHHSCPPSWIAKVAKNWMEAERALAVENMEKKLGGIEEHHHLPDQ